MNYDQIDIIKRDYPNSWEAFLEYSGLKTAWHPFDDPRWVRTLYDFFDSYNIVVEIGVDLTLEAKFCYRVFSLVDGEWSNNFSPKTWSDLFLTRIEAEEQAFDMAFKMLENE